LSLALLGAVQFETHPGNDHCQQFETAPHISSMGTKLFVGNLSFDVIENELQDLFAQAGTVNSVDIMQDRATGRSRGFGFVEMASEADSAKAISMFNGKEFKGRALTVNEARPREERGGGGGGYRGGGGGGGYRGGGGGRR
jgi:RNA recognition motif-containing protein